MVELVAFGSGEAHFPLLVGRDYSEKRLGIPKPKPHFLFLVLPAFIKSFRTCANVELQ